jgi:hypothetical protein
MHPAQVRQAVRVHQHRVVETPLRTRSTDVVRSISANASRSLVINTDRQPLRRGLLRRTGRTSSASYPGGTTVQIPALPLQFRRGRDLGGEIRRLGRPMRLVRRYYSPRSWVAEMW